MLHLGFLAHTFGGSAKMLVKRPWLITCGSANSAIKEFVLLLAFDDT